MRSKARRSARRTVSATASGCSAKRAAIAAGEASAEVELPRRRGSLTPGSRSARSRPARPGGGRGGGRGVDVAGGDGGDAEPLGEQRQPAVAGPVAAPVGTLQLDPEAVAAEGGEQPAPEPLAARRVPALEGPRQRPVPRAPREADEPLGVPLDLLQRRPGRFRGPRRVVPRMRVRRRKQPAEVPIPRRVLARAASDRLTGPKTRHIVRFSARRHGGLSSAPVIGRRPRPLAQWANSIEPQMPSWSVRARAG